MRAGCPRPEPRRGRADSPARVPAAGGRRRAAECDPRFRRPARLVPPREGPCAFSAPLLSLCVPCTSMPQMFSELGQLWGWRGAGWDWCQSQLGKTSVGVGRPQPQVRLWARPLQTWPSPAPFFTCSWRTAWLCRHSAGAAVLGWEDRLLGPDSRIRGRKGWVQTSSLREEGWGLDPGSEGGGLRPCAPGSRENALNSPDPGSEGQGGSCAGAPRPPAPPTAAPRCLGAAGETETRASAPVQGPGPLLPSPATKKAPPSLQTGTRGSQIPLDAHTVTVCLTP